MKLSKTATELLVSAKDRLERFGADSRVVLASWGTHGGARIRSYGERQFQAFESLKAAGLIESVKIENGVFYKRGYCSRATDASAKLTAKGLELLAGLA